MSASMLKSREHVCVEERLVLDKLHNIEEYARVNEINWMADGAAFTETVIGLLRGRINDLLEAQKSRLMSWEEVAAWNRLEESERDPIFVEYCPGKGFGPPCWTIKGFGYNLNYPTNSAAGYYGKYVRCWTGRPTQMQMEEAKWE